MNELNEKTLRYNLDIPYTVNTSKESYYLRILNSIQQDVKEYGINIQFISEYDLPEIKVERSERPSFSFVTED